MPKKEPIANAAQTVVGVKAEPIKSLVAMPANKRLEFFKPFESLISMVLPQGSDLNAARIVSLAVQLTSDYEIQNCDPKTIVGAIMQSVILGFEPIPGLGLAAFIPYGNKLHFQIEYKGYIDLLYRTNMYDGIFAEVVREGDEFDYWRGVDPGIIHKPKNFGGKLTHAYAVARMKGSPIAIFRVLTREEVLQIRDHYSQAFRAKKDTPWTGPREMEMWKKTAILQLQKDLPKSITIQKAIATDEKAISIEDFDLKSKEIDYSKFEVAEVMPIKPLENKPVNGVGGNRTNEEPPSNSPITPPPGVHPPTFQGSELPATDQVKPPLIKCIRCGEKYDGNDTKIAMKHLYCQVPKNQADIDDVKRRK